MPHKWLPHILMALSISVSVNNQPAYAFTPSTLFDGVMSAAVDYNKASKLFQYIYKVGNAASSQQSIQDFGITYESPDISQIQSPAGWEPELGYAQDKVLLWFYVGEDPNPIPPGARKTGFSFSSPCLPTIQSWLAQSSYNHEAGTLEEELEIKRRNLNHIFNNSNRGSIIGPGPLPPQSAESMLRTLIALLEKEQSYGWLTSPGLSRSLRAKLDAAQNSYSRGQGKAAVNQIKAFNNELEAQTGKALSPTAAELLKANADYLSSLL